MNGGSKLLRGHEPPAISHHMTVGLVSSILDFINPRACIFDLLSIELVNIRFDEFVV